MYVAIERARVLAYYSALTIAEDHPARARAALMAKAAAGECQQVSVRQRLPALRRDGLHLGKRVARIPQARSRRGPAARPGACAPQGALALGTEVAA